MITAKALYERLSEGGAPPMALALGERETPLVYRHARSARDEVVFVYGVEGAPLTVTVHAKRCPAHRMLTLRAHLRADRTLDEPVRSLRVFTVVVAESDTTGLQLRTFNGGDVTFCPKDTRRYPPREFAIRDRPLGEVEQLGDVEDGRCSRITLPIFVLHDASRGLWFGPEWSGAWLLDVVKRDGVSRLELTLPGANFVLHQGEEVWLPAITMGDYDGDVWEGCLALRRAIRDELSPKVDGRLPDAVVAEQVLGTLAPELDADGVMREAHLAAQLGMEALVFSTPWFRDVPGSTRFPDHPAWYLVNPDDPDSTYSNWWEFCGDFVPAASRFPNGIDAYAAQLRANGIMLGLWCDPRVNTLTREHAQAADVLAPFKRLREKDRIWDMGLIDLGRSEGRQYMLDLISRFVEEYGASWIWHDLNVEIRMRYWDHIEQPDRRGLMELRYMQGMHDVYDTVLQRYPHVRIEWCSSGGTMVDLGTLRRAHTFWVSDHAHSVRDGDIARAYRSCLNWILPASLILNSLYSPDAAAIARGTRARPPEGERAVSLVDLVTQFGSAFGLGHPLIGWRPADLQAVKEAVSVYKTVRPYLNREYWGLFKPPRAQSQWDGWQFHDPRDGSGLLVLFKLEECTTEEQLLTPRWIEPNTLETECLLGQARLEPIDGRLLATMPGRAALVRYRHR